MHIQPVNYTENMNASSLTKNAHICEGEMNDPIILKITIT
jgi:hypothetical protein